MATYLVSLVGEKTDIHRCTKCGDVDAATGICLVAPVFSDNSGSTTTDEE